jgi:hypothetical protein
MQGEKLFMLSATRVGGRSSNSNIVHGINHTEIMFETYFDNCTEKHFIVRINLIHCYGFDNSLENNAESFVEAVILAVIFDVVVGFGAEKKNSLLCFIVANRKQNYL